MNFLGSLLFSGVFGSALACASSSLSPSSPSSQSSPPREAEGAERAESDAVAAAVRALTCAAPRIKSCAYEPDLARVLCTCADKPEEARARLPWSGQSVAVTEQSHAFGGWATIEGARWRPGDTVDIRVRFGCGQGTQQVASVEVDGDGSFRARTNDVWRLCRESLASFEVESRTTDAATAKSTWLYWAR